MVSSRSPDIASLPMSRGRRQAPRRAIRHSPCGTATEQAARRPASVSLNAASMSPRFAGPRAIPAGSLMIAFFDT